MSLWMDYKAEAEFARNYPFGVPCDTWTTRDGTKIKLTDMTEQHIKNCMRIVGIDDEWYETFEQELKRREAWNRRTENAISAHERED